MSKWASNPLAATLAALRRNPAHARIALAGLSERETGLLIEAGVPTEGTADHALARALHERTEGNPFFVRETVQHLAETGRIARRGGRWELVGGATDLGVAAGVREVIGRRLARLSDACHRLLIVAAVIGREVDIATLTRAAGPDATAEATLDLLAEAETARLVSAAPGEPGRYRFAHALIQEALYEGLTAAQRARLHGRVGDALAEAHRANPDPYLAELAHHFLQTVPLRGADVAFEYAVRAAERAAALYAHEDAIDLHQSALDLFDRATSTEERRRCELLLALGQMQANAGAIQAAVTSYQQAIESARRAGNPKRGPCLP